MSHLSAGPLVIAFGATMVLVGILIWSGGLSWFGHLPGDIRIERDSTRIFIPITSCLALSVVLTLGALVFRRLFP
jgi:hypothetical protein